MDMTKVREICTDSLSLFKMGMCLSSLALVLLLRTLVNTVLEVFSRATLLAQSMLFSAQDSLPKDKSQDFVQESFT